MYGVTVKLAAENGILLTLNGSLAYLLIWSCLLKFCDVFVLVLSVGWCSNVHTQKPQILRSAS